MPLNHQCWLGAPWTDRRLSPSHYMSCPSLQRACHSSPTRERSQAYRMAPGPATSGYAAPCASAAVRAQHVGGDALWVHRMQMTAETLRKERTNLEPRACFVAQHDDAVHTVQGSPDAVRRMLQRHCSPTCMRPLNLRHPLDPHKPLATQRPYAPRPRPPSHSHSSV
jgi:hypothetical protein